MATVSFLRLKDLKYCHRYLPLIASHTRITVINRTVINTFPIVTVILSVSQQNFPY